MYRRLPQRRGWGNNPTAHYFEISFAKLDKAFKAGELVSPQSLVKKKLLPRRALAKTSRIKVLSLGKLSKSLKFENILFSALALKKATPPVASAPAAPTEKTKKA